MRHFSIVIALRGSRVVRSACGKAVPARAAGGDKMDCLLAATPDAGFGIGFHKAGPPPQIIPGASTVSALFPFEETV
ncbi:hypothetical protein ACEWPM_000835 [Roseovarius sp. S4756]|uniref:hypothetical protein n=1 Tax=Roseovarius maritimus TaxID=3342637 RepID=UPI00372873B2